MTSKPPQGLGHSHENPPVPFPTLFFGKCGNLRFPNPIRWQTSQARHHEKLQYLNGAIKQGVPQVVSQDGPLGMGGTFIFWAVMPIVSFPEAIKKIRSEIWIWKQCLSDMVLGKGNKDADVQKQHLFANTPINDPCESWERVFGGGTKPQLQLSLSQVFVIMDHLPKGMNLFLEKEKVTPRRLLIPGSIKMYPCAVCAL